MARPGAKRSCTLCAVDNTENKARLGAGAAPRPEGYSSVHCFEGVQAGVPTGGGARGLGRCGGPCSPASRFLGFPQIFTQQGNSSFCLSSNCCSRPSPMGAGWGGPGPALPCSPPPTGRGGQAGRQVPGPPGGVDPDGPKWGPRSSPPTGAQAATPCGDFDPVS